MFAVDPLLELERVNIQLLVSGLSRNNEGFCVKQILGIIELKVNQGLAKQGHEGFVTSHLQHDAIIRSKPPIAIQTQGFHLFGFLLHSDLKLEGIVNGREVCS